VRVAAIALLDGKVVLVRHRAGDARYHLLPGGGVGWGETLEEALIREVSEETGLIIRVGPPVIINDTIAPDESRHVVNITFASDVIGGAITDQPQDVRIEAVDLIEPARLTQLDLRPPIAKAVIQVLAEEQPGTRYLGSLYTGGR
jgi:8-oxo-dGTP diphosphatase